jgi:hypothetical protein
LPVSINENPFILAHPRGGVKFPACPAWPRQGKAFGCLDPYKGFNGLTEQVCLVHAWIGNFQRLFVQGIINGHRGSHIRLASSKPVQLCIYCDARTMKDPVHGYLSGASDLVQ